MKTKAVVKARGGGAQQWYSARQLSQLRKKCRTQYSWNLLLAGLFLYARTCEHGFALVATFSRIRLELQTSLTRTHRRKNLPLVLAVRRLASFYGESAAKVDDAHHARNAGCQYCCRPALREWDTRTRLALEP